MGNIARLVHDQLTWVGRSECTMTWRRISYGRFDQMFGLSSPSSSAISTVSPHHSFLLAYLTFYHPARYVSKATQTRSSGLSDFGTVRPLVTQGEPAMKLKIYRVDYCAKGCDGICTRPRWFDAVHHLPCYCSHACSLATSVVEALLVPANATKLPMSEDSRKLQLMQGQCCGGVADGSGRYQAPRG